MLTNRELATMLAALRHWQQTAGQTAPAELVFTWPQFAAQDPLSLGEIDRLCERLNECCGCAASGPFCCGIPGVLARIVHGRIVPDSIERCDACERFPSDAAARDYLAALGYLTGVAEA